jgi:hypothetical protein
VRAAILVAACLAGCAGTPPPDWQASAAAALDAAVQAHLSGDARQQAVQSGLARREIARTGRPALLARAELMLCAAATASLSLEPCAGFEALRADAEPAELAYAQYLAARPLARADVDRLPEAQRRAAAAVAGAPLTLDALRAIDDPLSRIIAVAVLFQAGLASPDMIALASDTASAQGWRRPLLAWLGVQLALAEKSGDTQAARQVQRRIRIVAP